MKARQHGFTLWELMVAVAVAGILLGIAVPSFRDFQRSNAMAAAANDLVTGALFARSEAVKRQTAVTLCLTGDPTAEAPSCASDPGGAFVVFVDTNENAAVDADDTVLLRSPAPGGSIRARMEEPAVTYAANGFPVGGAATRILLCDDRGAAPEAGGRSAARLMLFDPTGRGSIRSDLETVQAAVAELGCGT